MNELEVLQRFQKDLSAQRLNCNILQATEEIPYDRLFIFLGFDNKKREKSLEIVVRKQIMEGELENEDFYRVQFETYFPFSIVDYALSETSSLVFLLNRLIELPGLEIDEVENVVYYRYVLLTTQAGLHPQLIQSIVGLILLILDMFTDTIEQVSSGEMTFNELLGQVLAILEKSKKTK